MTAPSAAVPGQRPASAPPETVEIRVHGVHGTSPSSMLGLDPGDVGLGEGGRVVAQDVGNGAHGSRIPHKNHRTMRSCAYRSPFGHLTAGAQPGHGPGPSAGASLVAFDHTTSP